jgi:CheY-like chemotaxis protein
MARALVVEDDADLLELLGKHLHRLGCEVTLAKNGRAGLDALAECPPDVAIVDILLPDMDGHDVIEALRKAQGDRPCRIVTTSVLDPQDIGADSDAVLPKPFSRNDFDRVVRPLLEELRSAAP